MNISFSTATKRNTKCYNLYVGNTWLGISYQTVVAVRGYLDGKPIEFRRENEWGPTTGRHLKELNAYHLPQLGKEEFTKVVSDMINQDVMSTIYRRLDA